VINMAVMIDELINDIARLERERLAGIATLATAQKRIAALESGLREACEIIEELIDDTPRVSHAVRCRALRDLAGLS